MSKKLRFWLQILVSFLLLAILIANLDIEESRQILSQIRADYLILMFVVYAGDRILMALKWNMLLSILNEGFSRWDAIKVYYISSFVGYLMPLGGVGPDLVRIYNLRERGIPAKTGTVSIIVERVLGLIATLLIAIIGGLLLLTLISTGQMDTIIKLLLIVTIIGITVVLFWVFHDKTRSTILDITGLARLSHHPKFGMFFSSIGKYKEHKPVLLSFLALSVLENLFPVLVIFLAGLALEAPITFVYCLAVVPISTVLERLPISFAGIGLREGAYIVLFGLLGISYEQALMIGVVSFFAYLFSLAPGLYWMIKEGIPESKAF